MNLWVSADILNLLADSLEAKQPGNQKKSDNHYNKSGVKRLNTLGHLDQYMAQHGRIVKQSYCEIV